MADGTIPNKRRASLAVLVSDGRGGYETPVFRREIGEGAYTEWHTLVSAEGYRQMRAEVEMFEEMRPAFEALMPHLGACEHGEDLASLIEDGEMEWSINTYCCDPHGGTPNVMWMLWGMHGQRHDWAFCFARSYFRGVVGPYDGSDWYRELLDLGGASNVVELAGLAS